MTEGCQGNRPIKIKEKRNIEFILDAPYVSSPNLITVKDLKLLKPGIKIRVADDVFTRLQYVSGISRLFPGKEYIIKEVKVNEIGYAIIKVEGDFNYYGDSWFDKPDNLDY
ncbi:hypothetical protein J4230_04940 [Candidatus Woesearchaeota archaeon]|nr:hypothetical protein [Candidatus Woesearchaeota archaeon]